MKFFFHYNIFLLWRFLPASERETKNFFFVSILKIDFIKIINSFLLLLLLRLFSSFAETFSYSLRFIHHSRIYSVCVYICMLLAVDVKSAEREKRRMKQKLIAIFKCSKWMFQKYKNLKFFLVIFERIFVFFWLIF